MDRNKIFAEVVNAVVAINTTVDATAIRLDDTPFSAYGVTSLTRLQVGARVSERFQVPFGDSDALLAGSPLGLVRLIERRLAA